MQVEWVTSIREQCEKQSVPFFFKQWGGVRKSRNGRELNGRTYDEYPTVKRQPIPPLAVRRELESSLRLPLDTRGTLAAIT